MNTIDKLSDLTALRKIYRLPQHGAAVPSENEIIQLLVLIKAVLFPGFFEKQQITKHTIKQIIASNIALIQQKLKNQMLAAFSFNAYSKEEFFELSFEVDDKVNALIDALPQLRNLLETDLTALFNCDPAAKSLSEIIVSYPGFRAICNYRIANLLLNLDIPILPRIITELAHSETGIDIHPGATIGHSFAIDHGTGIVIGETAIIGNYVTIYQGVTLGAKNFPTDKNGIPIKGIPRHPILEDYVVIYAHATVLGRITIGKHSIIGGNVWVTNSLAANSKVFQQKPKEAAFSEGLGI